MTFEIKHSIFRSVIMLILSAFFILGMEIYQEPDVDGLATVLSTMEGYLGGKYQNEPSSAYSGLYELGAEELIVYSVPQSSKEFAVASFEYDAPETAGEIYKKRLSELKASFADNPAETERIEKAKIMLINQFAILTVYDSDDTTRNKIYTYLELD